MPLRLGMTPEEIEELLRTDAVFRRWAANAAEAMKQIEPRYFVEQRMYPEADSPNAHMARMRWCVIDRTDGVISDAPFDDQGHAEETCDHLNFGGPAPDGFDGEKPEFDDDPTGEVAFYERKKEMGFMG